MTYLVLTAVLIISGLITFSPRLQPFIQRYNTGINYFLTLLATFIGVLLALAMTNFEEDRKEKEHVIKLLNATIASVETSADYSENLIDYYHALPENAAERVTFYQKNPLPYPDYLDTFLRQNLISRNLSGAALSNLNELIINLKRTQASRTQIYLQLMQITQQTLESEKQFQQGLIDEATLEKQLAALIASLAPTSPPQQATQ